jgi:uncharacterized protein
MAKPQGIVMRAAHFPGRAPIDAYGNGGFRFADMSHKGSILCLPSGIHGWKPNDSLKLELGDFELALAQSADFDVLLIGMGTDIRPIPKALREAFRERRIIADPMSTGAAVRTFNVLLAEDRRVAAALICVD